jgi:hypothetical protein
MWQAVIIVLLLTVLTANLKARVLFPNRKLRISEFSFQVLCGKDKDKDKDKDCSSQSNVVNLWAIKA